ncbi:rhodanese-like domain-containing protein [Candidatus Binatus sp.]|uniref:rhodanese-like domain-containing protein n=1 Tax=Candidatus Binatus sp. TaxID=2811406 RepID=UPI003CC631DD
MSDILMVGSTLIVDTEAKSEAVLSEIPEISREELRRRLHDPSLTIVDVLPAESYAAGHVPGAVSIPLELVASRAPELLPDHAAEIVVYCGKLTCDRSEQALEQLHKLSYSNVRDYRAGIADWVESGEPTESIAEAASKPDAAAAILAGPPLTVSPTGEIGRLPARLSQMRRWDNSVLDLVQRQSTLQLFLLWLAMILLSGAGYWLGALAGEHGLVEAGVPVGADLKGFAGAIYFSFVTATSVGYGDIVPVGFARAIAVAEAISALLIFGAVVAKFVSHRQEELVLEIHRVTFEERLARVQTNFSMVISELLSIQAMCDAQAPLNGVGTRLDSAALIFLGEVRAIHDLLYQPRLIVEEGVLATILALLASAMNVLSELLSHLPPTFVRSQPLEIALENLTRLAGDICSTCVPHEYTPRLVFWMDRIQTTARKIK